MVNVKGRHMKDLGNNLLEEMNARLVNYLTMALGVILIFASVRIGLGKILGQILISVGTSILASAIVVLLSSRYLVKQENTKNIIENWGLTGIYKTRAKMNEYVNIDLEWNKEKLDIIAFGLKGFRDSKGDLIVKKVKRGMRLRIITIHPESVFLEEREKAEKCVGGGIKSDIIQLDKFVKELQRNQINEDQVKMKYYDSLPLDFYFGMDRSIYIGPYLYDIDSQQTISFAFKSKAEAYDFYTNYFEKRWNDDDFCEELDINSGL